MALISLVSVLAIGCGDTQDYVFTGTVPSTHGNVLFALDRLAPTAQVAADIPSQSDRVTVEFFDINGDPVEITTFDSNGNPVEIVTSKDYELEGTEPGLFEIPVEGVHVSATSFLLTVYDDEDIPLVEFQDDIAIVPGQTVPVDLNVAQEDAVVLTKVNLTIAPAALNVSAGAGASTAANASSTGRATVTTEYSNGELLPVALPLSNTSNRTVVITSSNTSVANVSATGVVTAVSNGTANFVARVTSYTQNVSSNTVVVTVVE